MADIYDIIIGTGACGGTLAAASIGAVNPGLTAMANALRVGDHLRQRLA